MSDFDRRNDTFSYAPPERSGGAVGALVFVVGIIALIFVAMLFMGSNGETTAPADPAAATAPATEGATSAPAAPAVEQ